MSKVKPCQKCGCIVVWDDLLKAPEAYAKVSKKELGFWREDLSKQAHLSDRCKTFQTSREFMEPQAVLLAQTHPNVKVAPSPLQVKEMNVTDLAEPAMRKEICIHCQVLSVIESEVIKFLGKDANPARVGLYINNIRKMLEK